MPVIYVLWVRPPSLYQISSG